MYIIPLLDWEMVCLLIYKDLLRFVLNENTERLLHFQMQN